MNNKAFRLGIISDTHGLVRPQALQSLQGCDLILHAGDVGDPSVLDELGSVAPVRAVRGNVDLGSWSLELPETDVVEAGGRSIYLLHDLDRLDLDPAAAGFQAVVFGHSHQPSAYRREGVLFLNPGSAGPRRFRLPISLALLDIEKNAFGEPRFIRIDDMQR